VRRDYIAVVRVANIIKLEMAMAVASSNTNRQPQSGSATVILGLASWWLMVFLAACLLSLTTVNAAGGDCMSGNTIDCFECNSWDDPRCHDPFNYTIFKKDMPPTKECEGCCVKMVQFIGTEYYQVKRTCTDDFDVNFFMVNHACMTEGHRHGHMCFCEEDECNHAHHSVTSSTTLVTSSLLMAIGLARRWTVSSAS